MVLPRTEILKVTVSFIFEQCANIVFASRYTWNFPKIWLYEYLFDDWLARSEKKSCSHWQQLQSIYYGID